LEANFKKLGQDVEAALASALREISVATNPFAEPTPSIIIQTPESLSSHPDCRALLIEIAAPADAATVS
jgi:hypothetical protein